MKEKREKKIKNSTLILENIPNFLSIARIFLTFVVIYMIFTNERIFITVVVFSIAAITDFLDGKIARKFKWESEFGRKLDILADRFLWAGTALAFLIAFGLEGRLNWVSGIQLLMIMTREIIAAPFALMSFFSSKKIPNAVYIAKITTFIQGFALPALILSVYYHPWIFLSIPLAIACAITGFLSALRYIHDLKEMEK